MPAIFIVRLPSGAAGKFDRFADLFVQAVLQRIGIAENGDRAVGIWLFQLRPRIWLCGRR